MFYIAAFQVVLLYRLDTRFMSPHIGRILGGGPPLGFTETDRAYDAVESTWGLVLPFPGLGDVGGRCEVGGDLRCPPSEQCH